MGRLDFFEYASRYRLVLTNANDGSSTPVLLMITVHSDAIYTYQKWHKNRFPGCKYRIDKKEKYCNRWTIGFKEK